MRLTQIRLLILILIIGGCANHNVLSQKTRTSLKETNQLSAVEIARKTLSSIALVVCTNGKDASQGSGFFVRPGILVTNYHVIRNMSRGVVEIAIGKNNEKKIFRIARIISVDTESDLVLLSVPAANIGVTTLNLAPVNYQIEVGETIYALGNPEGLVGTISPGIVSADIRASRKKARIQITAPISHGSSGGAVVNTKGQVIGVAVSSISEGQNLNFAVPVNLVHALLDRAVFPDNKTNELDLANEGGPIPSEWEWSATVKSTKGFLEELKEIVAESDQILFDSAMSNLKEGRFNDAIADLTNVIKSNPSAKAYYFRGNGYSSAGFSKLAIADYSKAIELDPKFFNAYVNRGAEKAELGEFGIAIADYNAAILLNPNDADVYFNRGLSYLNLRLFKQAVDDFTTSIQLSPRDANTFYYRGNAYGELGLSNRAIADYSKSIEISPKFVKAFFNRAVEYSNQEKYKLSLADYTRAIQLAPNDPDAYEARAFIYCQLGQKSFAKSDERKALKLGKIIQRKCL